MNINTAIPASESACSMAPVVSTPGFGSTLVITSGTAFLMLTSTIAVWSQVEPVILMVARFAG